MKKQVENVLIVTAKNFGKTEKETLATDKFKGISVEIVTFDLANRQFYQLIATINLNVKYA